VLVDFLSSCRDEKTSSKHCSTSPARLARRSRSLLLPYFFPLPSNSFLSSISCFFFFFFLLSHSPLIFPISFSTSSPLPVRLSLPSSAREHSRAHQLKRGCTPLLSLSLFRVEVGGSASFRHDARVTRTEDASLSVELHRGQQRTLLSSGLDVRFWGRRCRWFLGKGSSTTVL